MAVTDPDCPFHLPFMLGVDVYGSTDPMPVPILYDPRTNVAVVSPGYSREEYEAAADWLLSVLASARRASA